MHTCACGFGAKSAAGLASHRRRHNRDPDLGPNARAVEQTIAELERMGRLELIDAARVQLLRGLAAAVDGAPGKATLWREFRSALKALEEQTADGDDDDEIAALVAELSSPVRDTPAP